MKPTELEDEQLLRAWAEGDSDAGNELVERHFALVQRFFRNKVGRDLQDLVQQTFLGCIEARERFAHRSSFVTFLLGIARYQLFTYYKTRSRDPLDVTITSVHDLGVSPTGVLAKRDEEGLLAAAFQRLPLEAQVILELAYWEDLGGVEIAAVLGIPLNTAYSRMHRAKQSLRAHLAELAPDHFSSDRAWRLLDRVHLPDVSTSNASE